jgi:hypothetical protein
MTGRIGRERSDRHRQPPMGRTLVPATSLDQDKSLK